MHKKEEYEWRASTNTAESTALSPDIPPALFPPQITVPKQQQVSKTREIPKQQQVSLSKMLLHGTYLDGQYQGFESASLQSSPMKDDAQSLLDDFNAKHGGLKDVPTAAKLITKNSLDLKASMAEFTQRFYKQQPPRKRSSPPSDHMKLMTRTISEAPSRTLTDYFARQTKLLVTAVATLNFLPADQPTLTEARSKTREGHKINEKNLVEYILLPAAPVPRVTTSEPPPYPASQLGFEPRGERIRGDSWTDVVAGEPMGD
ncbi:uncharacterized protein KY384_003987 [Bacidia gigantensis]|uniref:uncharacterized protein n=1 Tax=Bacidia gigantensis TaxID=2732470 RepID=UPI001D04B642|nr:uncharacterized protein KY384_003987 [Bacidia gigantensis]KAG8532346.1 hypothetical protein KY384_003987 [Bacidia gigantensis]